MLRWRGALAAAQPWPLLLLLLLLLLPLLLLLMLLLRVLPVLRGGVPCRWRN